MLLQSGWDDRSVNIVGRERPVCQLFWRTGTVGVEPETAHYVVTVVSRKGGRCGFFPVPIDRSGGSLS